MKIEIQNPLHPGFYESIIDSRYVMDRDYESDNEELGGFLTKYDIEHEYDNKEYEKQVSNRINDLFIKKVNEEAKDLLGVENLFVKKIKEELVSPREYNFGTDRSFLTVEVEEKKFKQFIDLMFGKYHDDLKIAIKNHFTSCEGFISFYSNDIDDWKAKKYDYDHNELKTIFETLIDGYDPDDELMEIAYDVSQNIEYWYEWTKNGRTSKYSFTELQNLIGD